MEELTGAQMIAKERQEQIEKHGWSLDQDQYYANGELAQAALYCMEPDHFEWPRKWDGYFKNKIDSKSDINQLVVAGAFIAAEIDRLLRLKEANNG